MLLSQLRLQQFRSYPKQTFTFSPHTTLIIGVNTAGKTNILEALYFLATGKSFRADTDQEAIRWGSDFCHITGIGDEIKLELMVTRGGVAGRHLPVKKYMVNGVPRRLVDFVGNFRAVLFWPEHLELVTYSPSVRRRYLDSVLIQVDRDYRRNLLSYERGLRQRNKLLDLIRDGKAARHQLLFWNQLLTKSGAYITDMRAQFIEFINNNQLPISNYRLSYDKSVISETRLEQYKDEEVAAGATLVGPHRDDMVFLKNELDVSKYGSRGEQRLAILWLKLAEVSFIQEKTGDRPMLLLDDIFSELDEEHRTYVLELVGKQQSILTSAEANVVNLLKKLPRGEVVTVSL